MYFTNIILLFIILFISCTIGMFFVKNIMEGLDNTYSSDDSSIKSDLNTGDDIQEIQKNAVIPLHIYQTWHTKNLPPKMRECVNRLKNANPEFQHHLYDEDECREFIRTHFDPDVLDAFDSLIPLSYKSDLWRYCVLYKNGGIYLDVKFEPVDGFKFIELVDKEYFVLDMPYEDKTIDLNTELKLINSNKYYKNVYNKINTNIWKNKEIGSYTALIICKPNNPVLFECIQQIVQNVKNKFYGYNYLYPTGPGLLCEKYFKGDMRKINNIELFHSIKGNLIISKQKYILKMYDHYYGKEHTTHAKGKYYIDLWKEKNIYR
jgi:mannosyltransferase OCH1-like enzyme